MRYKVSGIANGLFINEIFNEFSAASNCADQIIDSFKDSGKVAVVVQQEGLSGFETVWSYTLDKDNKVK